MSQAAEQGLGEVFIAEQARPLVVLKVRGDERGLAAVALFHQLEEDIRLLGTQIEIPDLIDQEDIEARPAPDEFARSSVGDRSVHLQAATGRPCMTALPYRPGVGIMLISKAGLVFVAKRIDLTSEAWQMPQ